MDKQNRIGNRKEISFTFLYNPYFPLYSNFELLSEYNFWNYDFNFTAEYNSISDIFSTVNNVQLEKNNAELSLKLKLLYGAGFLTGSYINNIAESLFKVEYSYRKLEIISSITGIVTYSHVNAFNYFTGTTAGNFDIKQNYTNLLPSLSLMGAVWSSPFDIGYNYAFTVYPSYRLNKLNIGAALRISGKDYFIYPAIFYEIMINKILDIFLYAVPELGIERGLDKYLIQNVTSETFLPVSNFEKFGIKFSTVDWYSINGYLAAEILHGNFLNLRQNDVTSTPDTILNIKLDYSQIFNRWFYGELTYKFQEELGYPFPSKVFSKTPAHVLYLKVQFDFIKIPLQIIINTGLTTKLLLGENFEWATDIESRSKDQCSAWFVIKTLRHYDFGMIFTLYIDKNDGLLKFENSFFLKSKKIKVRS